MGNAKYLVHAEHNEPGNSMTIECDGVPEMVHYALACVERGYDPVRTEIVREVEHEEEPKPLHGNVIS